MESHKIADLRTWVAGPADREPRPTLILLHGRGADGRDLASIQPYLDFAGGRVVCPDAPRPWIEGGGQGFSWFGTEALREDLDPSLAALRAFLDALPETLPIDGLPILGGFSQGGVLTYELGLRHPELFRALAVLSSYLAPDHPIREAPTSAEIPPLLITHGTYDPLIPIARSAEARAVLDDAGVSYRFVEDAVDHTIGPRHLEALNALLAEVVR
jgi:phospholipase/carboxylesterase